MSDKENNAILPTALAVISLALILSYTGSLDYNEYNNTIDIDNYREDYTIYSKEACYSSNCLQTIYSYPKYSDSKGTLINETKSLMYSEFQPYDIVIEEDGIHKVTVLDFNSTSILLDIEVLDKEIKEFPIKIYDFVEKIEVFTEELEKKNTTKIEDSGEIFSESLIVYVKEELKNKYYL
jgi:hypothetical protein